MNHLSIFSSGKMVPSVFASLVAVLFLSIPGAFAQSPSTSLLIVTRDASDKPVVGAVVDVKRNGTSVTSGVTNEKGEAHFTDLPPGNYQVVISKDGFQEDTEDNVQLTGTRPEQVLIGLSPKVHIDEAVNVHAQPDQAVDPGATPLGNQLQPSTLNATPTKPATVSDALPLVPGVVRTPEGQLKISGSDENRSALIVNAVDATDPATGQFGVTVPVDSVETVNVFQTPYLAEFGRFTAGVVSVETKRGGDKWNYELNDPLPDFRIFSGHLRGIRDATPRLVFNGPLIKDKLYFSEGLEYELDKTPIKSLAFPFNETKRESVNSFTQFDYIVSQTQTLTGTFHLAPWHANHLNLDFFNPQPVTPAFSAKDYTGAVTDNLTIGATSLLQSTLGVKHFTGDVWAQGPLDMTLSPLGNSGNYFSQQSREALRIEWLEIYSLAPIVVRGTHNIKVGSSITRTTNRGEFIARPVNIVDGTGALLERIDFVGGSPFNRRDLGTAFFGEDHWQIRPNLSMDLGLRFEHQGITETTEIAPRIGIAWAPAGVDKTVIRGGFGLFFDGVPLGVYSFDRYPEQLVTTFGPGGQIIGGPTLFANITDRAERTANPFIQSENNIGNFAPYSATWNVEVDQPIGRLFRIRANYLQSNSDGVVTVTPRVVDGRDALVLGGSGKSGYRQFELVGKLTLNDRRQLFMSYVRSHAQGNLNQFNSYLGNFPFPIVRPDTYTNLPGDLPNRFLAWGVFGGLPWRMRVSPMVEYRNGFPYPLVDAHQNYVGTPFTTRYPNFYSFDARVSKDIKVSDKYTLRLSVSGYNITNHFNPSAVHANVADPQVGLFFGNYKRHLTADFDILF